MAKQPRAYYRPTSLAEAWQLLSQPNTVPLGGGTKLLAGDMTSTVVDLQAVGLGRIQKSAGICHIGSTTKLADLAQFLSQEAAHSPAPLLIQAIQRAGANTYRHAATVGGTVASQLPDSELLATWLVLEAMVSLYPTEGESLSLDEYWQGQNAGILTTLHLPLTTGRGAMERVARTPADYPIVSVVLWQPENAPIRLAATGIDQLPIRLYAVETALAEGQPAEQATEIAKGLCRHNGDFRGSANYRAEMVKQLTLRLLNQ